MYTVSSLSGITGGGLETDIWEVFLKDRGWTLILKFWKAKLGHTGHDSKVLALSEPQVTFQQALPPPLLFPSLILKQRWDLVHIPEGNGNTRVFLYQRRLPSINAKMSLVQHAVEQKLGDPAQKTKDMSIGQSLSCIAAWNWYNHMLESMATAFPSAVSRLGHPFIQEQQIS